MSTYDIMNEMESYFEKYDDEISFKKFLVSEGKSEHEIENYLLNFKRYKKYRSVWDSFKFLNDPDTIIIKGKNNIKEIVEGIKNNTSSKKVLIVLENKTYEDFSLLLSELEGYDIRIYYAGDDPYNNMQESCTPQEFEGMRAAIDYYKSIIEKENLSPIETIMYFYDIVKSLTYREATDDLMQSRSIHTILKDNYIVCVGYCKLLQQLLKEVGLNSCRITVDYPDIKSEITGHERLLMRVEDEKYGVSGLFFFDPTFDKCSSMKMVEDKEGTKYFVEGKDIHEGDTILKNYDELSLYKNFLVPVSDYPKIFKGSKIKKYQTKDGVFEAKPNIIYTIENGLANPPTRKMDITMFIELMYKIRLIEGYPEDTIVEQINDALEVNRYSNKDETELIEATINKSNKKMAA